MFQEDTDFDAFWARIAVTENCPAGYAEYNTPHAAVLRVPGRSSRIVRPQLLPYKPCLPAPNGLLKTTIRGPVDLLGIYDDRFALTRWTASGFQVWNLDSLEMQHYLCDGYKVESNITFQDETSKLVAQTFQTTLNLWDIESGSIIRSMNVFPQAVDSQETPLKWAIEVLCISSSKTMCLVKIIANFLIPNKNTRLLLCDFVSGKVSPDSSWPGYNKAGGDSRSALHPEWLHHTGLVQW